jgi:hypothetical protein
MIPYELTRFEHKDFKSHIVKLSALTTAYDSSLLVYLYDKKLDFHSIVQFNDAKKCLEYLTKTVEM